MCLLSFALGHRRWGSAAGLVRTALIAAVAALALSGPEARAHGGEDHSHGDQPAVAVTTAQPRVSAQSGTYELVGILQGERLAIYLDRFSDNAPVTDARMEVMVGDDTVPAERNPDGTYSVSSPRFAGSGTVELAFAVTGKDGDDLLTGTLALPDRAPPIAAPAQLSPLQKAQQLFSRVDHRVILIAGIVLGALVGLGLRARRVVPIAALALLTVLALTSAAYAHEGEDHSHGARATPAQPASDTSRRLPDGSVFVPKPTQRLLELRTTVTKPETAERAYNLIGRVISDPNRSGLVQSINGGRVIAPEPGLPQLGRAVRKGEVLAQVEPALPAADRATLAEKAGDIEQQIALVEAKLQRLRRLAASGTAPAAQVTDAEIELESLKRRREIIRETRAAPEVLRAPIDGVIASVRVVAGQVVQAQDVLFQIIDPKALWVEALVFSEIDPASIGEATATATDGKTMKLAYKGWSRALQQQATIVQFAIVDPPSSISVGQPLTVLAKRKGQAVAGIVLPRDAVVRGNNGEAIVWRHAEPERFEARPVRTEPLDAARLVIVAGVGNGERVVVRGAELVNQIR